MDNIQNLPNAGLEDVFDIQSLYSKMNTESSEERQKTLSALREKARRYLPETERTAKYLNALIEYKTPSIGSLCRGVCSFARYAYQRLSKGISPTKCAIWVLLLFLPRPVLLSFGYDLDAPKEATIPQTVADLYAQELAAFLVSLGPDAMDDISRAIINSSHVDVKVKPLAGRLFSKTKKVFYGDDGKPILDKLNYNSYISEAKKQ